jgi:solute carrier family 25 carnitine/acylcarnitine transporter 20/29
VYSGSVDAAAKILKTYGIKGLFTGLVPTVFRECVGSTLYFTGYEFMMRKFLKPGQKTSDAPIHASILSGAFAGLCFWFLIYPVDFIKTSIQTDNLAQRKYKGMLDVFNEKLK